MAGNHNEIEKRLWSAADELRANSKLKSSEYSVPVLGLIFLRYADHKFTMAKQELDGKSTGRRAVGKTDYQAQGVLYLPEAARFSRLLNLPEGADIGKAINESMRAIEAENEELKDILPKTYNHLDNSTLVELLKTFNSVPMDIEGDAFGKIYEYFLGKFAMSEGQKGGEFFTPTSIVKLIVEVIEPYHGRIFDPACGSGGMFVQSARFV
ncbi:putative type I restriction enzymeP M protein [Methanosarcinales archaeon]|nr:putative type I restriction enzymeP M protein [Methanosarcinales archaeon]